MKQVVIVKYRNNTIVMKRADKINSYLFSHKYKNHKTVRTVLHMVLLKMAQ